MRVGSALAATSRGVALAEQWAAVLALVVMTTAVAMQIIWRFVLSAPLAWTEELARLAMVWLVFLVVGWAIGNRTHIAADFLVQALPPRVQLWVEALTLLAVAAFSALLLVVGTRLVILQSVAANTPLGLPRSVFSLQVPVSALFVLVHAADLLCRCREKLRALPPGPAAGAPA